MPAPDAPRAERALEAFRARYTLRCTPLGASRDGWHRLQVYLPHTAARVRARKGYRRRNPR